MEWLNSGQQIKHVLYKKENGYTNWNVYYCSNCGYSKIIKVGSQNKTKRCPLCKELNTNYVLKCHKERLKHRNKRKHWRDNRRWYRQQLATALHNTCECCRHVFDFEDLVIHHLVPHKGDFELMNDFKNMYLCCADCHTLIHKRLAPLDDINRSDCLKAIKKARRIRFEHNAPVLNTPSSQKF